MDDLPADIVEDILLKLPIKSIFQFKSVAKRYLNIISNPSFEDQCRRSRSPLACIVFEPLCLDYEAGIISLVRQFSDEKEEEEEEAVKEKESSFTALFFDPRRLLFPNHHPDNPLGLMVNYCSYRHDNYISIIDEDKYYYSEYDDDDDDDDYEIYRNYDIDDEGYVYLDCQDFERYSTGTFILHSCNGLLLCSRVNHLAPLHYYVCNPVTRQWIELPEPRHGFKNCMSVLHFPAEGRSFEVFRFTLLTRRNQRSFMLETYSSETGEWSGRRVSHSALSCIHRVREPSLVSDGVMYWIDKHQQHRRILVYHIEDRLFSFLPLPFNILELCSDYLHKTSSSRGILYYVKCCHHDLQVWALDPKHQQQQHYQQQQNQQQQQLWSLRHQIRGANFDKVFGMPNEIRYLGFHPMDDNKILVVNRKIQRMSIYDMEKGTLDNIWVEHRLWNYELTPHFFIPIVHPAWPVSIPQVQKGKEIRRSKRRKLSQPCYKEEEEEEDTDD